MGGVNRSNGTVPASPRRRRPGPVCTRLPTRPEEKWTLWFYMNHNTPPTLVRYRRGPHWGTVPHFSSGDTWIICFQVVSCRGNTSVSPHLLPPALSPKLISCADAFVFVLRRWFDTIIITPAPMRGFPPLTQSNIIRVSQWCWLEITTFFKRCRKFKIQMIWK